MRRHAEDKERPSESAAGNGILDRRLFLEGAFIAAAGAAGTSSGISPARAEPLAVPRWMKEPGAALSAYGQPSPFERKVVRSVPPPPNPATQGIGVAAHAASVSRRHDHAQRAAFRAQPFRRARHRSRSAPPR